MKLGLCFQYYYMLLLLLEGKKLFVFLTGVGRQKRNERVKYYHGKRLDKLAAKMSWKFQEDADTTLSPRHSQLVGSVPDKSI